MNGGQATLTDAVQNRDFEALRRRLAEGTFDPAGDDVCRALGLAAACGLPEIVDTLLDVGVSANRRDEHGVTALMLAARAGQTHISRVLVQRGADLEARDILGQTPLFYAVEEGLVGSAAALLELGADPLARDRKGKTALYYARRRPLLNFEIPDWVPLVGGLFVFGLTYRFKGTSQLIEILENASRESSAGAT